MPRTREVRLVRWPRGAPKVEDFEIVETHLPALGDGDVLIRNIWMSVDPYMRGRMYADGAYNTPYKLGEVLDGGAIGEVVRSGDSTLKPGDLVDNFLGWREAFIAPAATVRKLPARGLPPQLYLGAMGMPGLTAYGGLLEIGKPQAGETVFVSGAAGAVGSLVVQIAKNLGCFVIASAGTQEKAHWLMSIGADRVVNYKTARNLTEALGAAAHRGVDVYFDNVGGDHLEAAIHVANRNARICGCGMISQYDRLGAANAPKNMFMLYSKTLKLEGFTVAQFLGPVRRAFLRDMSAWITAGKIQCRETIFEGLDNAPAAFVALFSGANTGKMLVKLGDGS
jgi:NADPH-dependent curcumin reductase CurA